jgi:hypothetical protein
MQLQLLVATGYCAFDAHLLRAGAVHRDSAVDAISLADGTVATNGFPDELCKTIHKILILQQLA